VGDAYIIRICSDILQSMQDREEPLTEKQSEEQTMRAHSVFRLTSTAESKTHSQGVYGVSGRMPDASR